ncbi:MAG: hypothetical protein WC501_02175 [Candidatus Micrarchaeia archaeon]
MIITSKTTNTSKKERIIAAPLAEKINNGKKDKIAKILELLEYKKPGVLIIIDAIKLKIELEQEEIADFKMIAILENAIKKHEPIEWLSPVCW